MLDRIPPPVLDALLKVRDRIRGSRAFSQLVFIFLRALRGPEVDAGWLRSFRAGRSVDAEGQPLPWIAYGAIGFLEQHLRKDMTVFEYGAGNSTRWWAERVAQVSAVENDEAWVAEIAPTLPGNATVRSAALGTGNTYARAALDSGQTYHIIVVDGRERVACARACLPALREDGVILFDNSERRQYREALTDLAQQGFERKDFPGMGPIATVRSQTSIFYRPDNCLGLGRQSGDR